MRLKTTLLALLLSLLGFSQPSPWGTGLFMALSLDTLSQDTLYQSHVGESFALNSYLDAYSYAVFVPPAYDGTEPYGLITFINAGNAGNIISAWIPVLEEEKIIIIAGNNIGNSVNVPDRIGVALAGAHALSKTLNIDAQRIYASGSSGGGRTASVLMFMFPEFFTGLIPNCGSAYLRQVDQDYETHQPNSHYEYIYPFTTEQMDYVQSFKPRMALLTAYDDFREGDLMNIYHNGAEPDGMEAKLLEIPGSHCASSTQHFRDGLHFLEHPNKLWISDSFDFPQALKGDGYLSNAQRQNGTLLLADAVNFLSFKNPFAWNDPYGAIMRIGFRMESRPTAGNDYLNIGWYDLSDGYFYDSIPNPQGNDSQAYFLWRILGDSAQAQAVLLYTNPAKGYLKDTLFAGRFVDWDSSATYLKVHAWDTELRWEFGKHFEAGSFLHPNLKLLDDQRSLQMKRQNFWDSSDFKINLLHIGSGRSTNQVSSAPALLNVQVIVADTSESGVLATTDSQLHSKWQLYPNPSRSLLNLKSPYYRNCQISIIDAQGRLILSFNHRGLLTQMDLSSVKPGLYRLLFGDGSQSQNLLILPPQ